MPVYNIVTALLGLATAGLILYLVRKDRLSVNYTLWWGLVAAGLIITGFVPRLTDFVGALLGVHYPPILFVIIAILMVFIKILFMDIHRSKHEQQIKILAQRLALYENQRENSD
ncbi:MAG: DUF2304 domain-containing protein [Desulfobacterales bacterium]|nr:DUF2304 domain-containing protein [Desulfobacterales bacterium]